MVQGEALLVEIGIVLVALLVRPFAKRCAVAYPVVLIVLGFAAAEIMIRLGFDPAIRQHRYALLVDTLFLPTIIYALAYGLTNEVLSAGCKLGTLLGGLVSVATLAVLSVLFILFFPNQPLSLGVLIAALLMPTCALLLQEYTTPLSGDHPVLALLKCESVVSTLIAVIIVKLLIASFGQVDAPLVGFDWFVEFFFQLFGGLFVGVMVGGLSLGLLMLDRDASLQTFVTIATVYFAYLFARDILHVSGAVAVITVAVCYRCLAKPFEEANTIHFVENFWNIAQLVMASIVFLLIGAVFSMAIQSSVLLAAGISMIAVLLTRWGLVQAIARRSPDASVSSTSWRALLLWGGLRATIPLALLLTVPDTYPSITVLRQVTVLTLVGLMLIQIIPLRRVITGTAS